MKPAYDCLGLASDVIDSLDDAVRPFPAEMAPVRVAREK